MAERRMIFKQISASQLIPQSKVVLDKLAVAQLFIKLFAVYIHEDSLHCTQNPLLAPVL